MLAKTLIVIVGPTAIGKTSFAIGVAKALNTEIISADSRQFYKEMTIGTAVPSKDELKQVKHHFIHSHSIHDELSAGEFERQALKKIEMLFETKDTLVLVGGSGLYIDAVCQGIDDIPSDKTIKEKLIEQHKKDGLSPLLIQLEKLDPTYFKEVDKNNPVRIIRALETSLATGKPYSSFKANQNKKRPFRIVKIGLNTEREILYERINKRVDLMMQEGLLEEGKALEKYKSLNALQTVGYKELFAYLNNETSLEKAIEEIKKNSRRYAKRQLTWFKRDASIRWFDIKDVALARKYAIACVNS